MRIASADYEPALWGELLATVKRLVETIRGQTFRGSLRPATARMRALWKRRLSASTFSEWAVSHIDTMTYELELHRKGEGRVLALLPSRVVPSSIKQGIQRVWTLRAWLDGGPVEIQHAHLPVLRRARPTERLGPTHVNGGMTLSVCGQPIVCYRAEEAPKVWSHEYLHHRCVDAAFRHARHGPGILAEAYVETWATLWNVLHRVVEANPRAGMQELVNALEAERRFVLAQAAKVIYHQQGATEWNQIDLTRWKETTNLWSYYVVRAAWWWDLTSFLRTSPRPGLGAPDTLRWEADHTMASPEWRATMGELLRATAHEAVRSPGTPWSLRMTSPDEKSTEERQPTTNLDIALQS